MCVYLNFKTFSFNFSPQEGVGRGGYPGIFESANPDTQLHIFRDPTAGEDQMFII